MPIIKTENGYIYKKTAKRTGFSKPLFLLLLFFLSICVVAGSFFVFSKVDITSALKLNKYMVFEEKTYFAISLNSADSFSKLSSKADEIKIRDGAGFVMKSGEKYYLIANVYASFEDAQKIATQLKSQQNDFDIEILEIQFDRIIISSSHEMKQILMIKDALNMVNETFDNLNLIVSELDRGEIANIEALNKLKFFEKTCRENKETFANAFQNISENLIVNVKIFQSEVVSALSIISASQNLSSDIKHTILSVFQNFLALQNKILKWWCDY